VKNMVLICFVLPPRGTLFNKSLVTSLILFSSYANPEEPPQLYPQSIKIKVPDDEHVAHAIELLVNDLKNGSYGIQPQLGVDKNRLNNLCSFFSEKIEKKVSVDAESILSAYVQYVKILAERKCLIKELQQAMNEFKDGYPNDAKICNIPMLNRLMPEFMEGIRTFGGVGMSSVSSRFQFSRMRIGPHSACFGIMGIWAGFIAFQDNFEYYIFPDFYVTPSLSKEISNISEVLRRIATELKRRPPTHLPTLALLVALSTIGFPKVSRMYEMVVISGGMFRIDLLESDFPLSSENYLAFADSLKNTCESEATVKRLLNLLKSALEQPATGESLLRKLRDIGLRTSQLITMCLMQAISPDQMAYEIARLFYAQSDIDFEKYARKREAFLYPGDVSCILRAIERLRENKGIY